MNLLQFISKIALSHQLFVLFPCSFFPLTSSLSRLKSDLFPLPHLVKHISITLVMICDDPKNPLSYRHFHPVLRYSRHIDSTICITSASTERYASPEYTFLLSYPRK